MNIVFFFDSLTKLPISNQINTMSKIKLDIQWETVYKTRPAYIYILPVRTVKIPDLCYHADYFRNKNKLCINCCNRRPLLPQSDQRTLFILVT